MRARVGAIIKRVSDAVKGFSGSLVNSFIASAKGWSTPYGPTTFGPFRSCIYPRVFRSTRVRKAMATRIGSNRVNILIRCTIRERI